MLENFTHRTPGSQNLSDTVKILVRSLCRVLAQEVPWMGLGRRSGPYQNKLLLDIFTHRTPGSQNLYDMVTWYKVWLGAYVEFQPVGWPG